ncbi:MAG: hypothetical protein PVG87_21915, partial [Desulfobacteraceae bacterium]
QARPERVTSDSSFRPNTYASVKSEFVSGASACLVNSKLPFDFAQDREHVEPIRISVIDIRI